MLLDYFPILKKLKEAYNITLLSVYPLVIHENQNNGARRDSHYNINIYVICDMMPESWNNAIIKALNRWPLLDNISVFRPSNSQISAHCG
jgi:hypothetical protein